MQNETFGHRGHEYDPLYCARRLLTKAYERLDEKGRDQARRPAAYRASHREVQTAWHAKEVVRSIYEITDPAVAEQSVSELGQDLQDESCPPEVLARAHNHAMEGADRRLA